MYFTATVTGDSMKPTLNDGDLVVIDASCRSLKKLAVDDIICFKMKGKGRLVKRIKGLPGDIICIGKDRYLVPNGHIFVIGDNIKCSNDSRHFGYVHINSVVGKVVKYSAVERTKYGKSFKSCYDICRSVIFDRWNIE